VLPVLLSGRCSESSLLVVVASVTVVHLGKTMRLSEVICALQAWDAGASKWRTVRIVTSAHCLTRLCPDEQLKHCIGVPTLPCLYSANGMSHRHMACTNLIAKVNGSKQARPRVEWWVGKSSRAEAVRG
jgi:hypothetical protein